MTPEGKVKAIIKMELDKLKPDIWYYCVQDRFTSGIPDIVGCYKGKLFALELKAPKKRPSKLQHYTLELIAKAGGYAQVITSFPELKQFLKSL